jgi:hypothetical protein
MQKPFLKLGEYLGTPLEFLKTQENCVSEKPYISKEKDWSDIVHTSKPLREKIFTGNFHLKKLSGKLKRNGLLKGLKLRFG